MQGWIIVNITLSVFVDWILRVLHKFTPYSEFIIGPFIINCIT